MANIAVTKENGGKVQAPMPREWDPFRTMRELMRWEPFSALSAWPAEARDMMNVAFDVKETKDGFVFRADVPGIDPKDIDVKLHANRLTISGKREEEKTDKSDTYYTYERTHGSFTRSFTLPEGIDTDNISADLKSGVLTLTLPKKLEARAKQISVKGG
jgi:HSP20 family protein